MPFWSKEGPAQKISTYNARAESVHSAPSYRGPWRSRRRCLVPAIAWHEPAKTLGMKGWARVNPSASAITFGGLWDSWKPGNGGQTVHSFTIITTELAPSIAHVHNRMPLIIPATERDRWIDPDVAAEAVRHLLVPVEDDCRIVTPDA